MTNPAVPVATGKIKHQCFECKRWGTRAMHQILWGTRAGQWRCDSAIACDKRRLSS